MNLAKSHRREVIVRIQSMMVYIMPYQVWKCDALEIPILNSNGLEFLRRTTCVAMTKRLCGASDWHATPRTFRPRHRAQRAASQETYVVVSGLLSSVANTPVLG